jgi:hypothetical protein
MEVNGCYRKPSVAYEDYGFHESQWLLWKFSGVYGSQWLPNRSLIAMENRMLLLQITGCYEKLFSAKDVNCCYEKSMVAMRVTGCYGISLVVMKEYGCYGKSSLQRKLLVAINDFIDIDGFHGKSQLGSQ